MLSNERIEEIRQHFRVLMSMSKGDYDGLCIGDLLGHVSALSSHVESLEQQHKHDEKEIELRNEALASWGEKSLKDMAQYQDLSDNQAEAIRTCLADRRALRAALEEVLEYAGHIERNYGVYLMVHGFDPPFGPEAKDIGIRARKALTETSG